MIYMICDGHGNQLCDGIAENVVARIAQRMANERGESVWAYPRGEDEGEEYAPAAPCCYCGNPGGRTSATVPGDIPCAGCEAAERAKGTWDDVPDAQ